MPVPQKALYLEWGGKLVITPTGGLQVATGWDVVRQFLERFLLTNRQTVEPSGIYVLPDYIFEPGYGLGLGSIVGELIGAVELQGIENLCLQAVAAMTDPKGNPLIASTPPPQVTVTQNLNEIVVLLQVSPLGLPPGTIAIAFAN